jgi:hypothetical protein
MTLANVTYRITVDPNFAVQLCAEPKSTLEAAGLELTDGELSALLTVLRQKVSQVHTSAELLLEWPDWFSPQF